MNTQAGRRLCYSTVTAFTVLLILLLTLYSPSRVPALTSIRKYHMSPPEELSLSTSTAKHYPPEVDTLTGLSLSTKNTKPSPPIILPCSAYIDIYFKPSGTHKNASIILMAIMKVALKDHLITGCECEGYETREFKVESFIQNGWVHKAHPSLTHDDAVLTCYNMPVPHNGSATFVLYKDEMGHEQKIETERKIYSNHGVPKNGQTMSSLSLVVCTTAYGKPPWISEWLLYQKTIGVDHIHVYAQESFVTEGSANNSVLQEYINSGYATLEVWKTYLNKSQVHNYQQVLFYQDCVHRYRNRFGYALLYDVDDFFVPQVSEKTDIHYYVENIFHQSTVGSAMFTWSGYYPDCGLTQNSSTIEDGNLTHYLVTYKHREEYFKAMHKLSGVQEVGIHEAVRMVSGYGTKRVPRTLAYVAHIRKGRLPPGGCHV